MCWMLLLFVTDVGIIIRLPIMHISVYRDSHLLALNSLPRQWVVLDTSILQSLRSRISTSVSLFFFTSLLMVSISMSVFLWVSHLLPPCPALFWSFIWLYHLYHVHTSVVAILSLLGSIVYKCDWTTLIL